MNQTSNNLSKAPTSKPVVDDWVHEDLLVPDEFARAWATYMATTQVPKDWLTKTSGAVSRVLPGLGELAQEWLWLCEESARRSFEAAKQTVRTVHLSSLDTTLQGLAFTFEAGFSVFRNSARAASEFNAQTLQIWSDTLFGEANQLIG
jgi:hypothetical protein